ncbi:hypothetical protein Q6A83_00685 [Aliarcobacter skirrowii]|nr:hypothetical protein [Aliarcobacter skirrowii]MDX4049288.1 hypothetical protein [Aliarcobacter skirrowii]
MGAIIAFIGWAALGTVIIGVFAYFHGFIRGFVRKVIIPKLFSKNNLKN